MSILGPDASLIWLLALISAVVCGVIAFRRGSSGILYFGIGTILGLGGIPLTLLATSPFHPPTRSGEGMGFIPLHQQKDDSSGALDSVMARRELESWQRLSQAMQNGLAITIILSACGFFALAIYAVSQILPTFVTLFEGMSLKLPLPTQFLINLTKGFQTPYVMPLLWLGTLIYPGAAFWFFPRGGYGTPIFGRIWRHTDQLWRLYSQRCYGNEWASAVPDVVRTRLERLSLATLGGSEDQMRCERDALNTELWILLPTLVVIVGLTTICLGFVAWATYLPMYQLIGNVG